MAEHTCRCMTGDHACAPEHVTTLADIDGVVIDLAKVPDHPKGSHRGLQVVDTGRTYLGPDGEPVAVAQLVPARS